jgi:hypothetical protein
MFRCLCGEDRGGMEAGLGWVGALWGWEED